MIIRPEELWFKIDEEDLVLIKPYKWFKQRNKNGGRYALAHVYRNGKRTSLYMHKLIMDSPKGMEIDHVNGDGWDNRKCNLRVCTRQQNTFNQHRVSPTTGYRGVYLKRNKNYYAGLEFNGKGVHLGIYKTAKEAAKAYNEGAKKYYGEFAYLNQI